MQIKPPTAKSQDLLTLLVAKKCPRPTTKDPREPYSTDSRAHGTFLTSRNPRSLKDYEEKKTHKLIFQ